MQNDYKSSSLLEAKLQTKNEPYITPYVSLKSMNLQPFAASYQSPETSVPSQQSSPSNSSNHTTREQSMTVSQINSIKNRASSIWNSTLLQGTIQFCGGVAETIIGIAVAEFAPPVGGALILHGSDHLSTGLATAMFGQTTETYTAKGLQTIGLAQPSAYMIDGLMGAVGSMGGAALIRANRLATIARSLVLGESEAASTNYRPRQTYKNAKNEGRETWKLSASSRIMDLKEQVSEWLGEGTKLINNNAGDPIFLSQDRLRRIRFDFKNTDPHQNVHVHLDIKVNGK